MALGLPHILLIDDDPADLLLTQEAFELAELQHLSVAQGGEEALAFLHREGAYAHAERPDLILLDLNMPRISGLEVLRRLNQDQDLRHIPVLILSTSRSQRDVELSLAARAQRYIQKPVSFSHYQDVVNAVKQFWQEWCSAPEKAHSASW